MRNLYFDHAYWLRPRVSTRDHLELQLDALNKAGRETIFQEKASRATEAHLELERVLAEPRNQSEVAG